MYLLINVSREGTPRDNSCLRNRIRSENTGSPDHFEFETPVCRLHYRDRYDADGLGILSPDSGILVSLVVRRA